MHYNDPAAGRIATLDGLSKADLNNQLLKPLSDSALKKIAKADLLAMVEAEAAQEKQAAKKQRAPRRLDDRVIVAPTTDPEAVKAVVEGSKRAVLLTMLARDGGCTLDELQATLGWTRDTVTSAFAVDVKATGFGVERKDQTYRLVFPAGVKAIPIAAKGQKRADAVAGCR